MGKLIQPTGSVSTETNKQSLARIYGCSQDEIIYIENGIDLSKYKILYDDTTQSSWEIDGKIGIISSYTILDYQCTILTTTGTTVILYKFNIVEKIEDSINYVTPEMFRINGKKYIHSTTVDAVPYIQAAIDYGKQNNLPVKLSQVYYCLSAPQTVVLPRDDGTAYPAWVTSGNDANITAEPIVTMPAHLRLYNNSVITGSGRFNTILYSTWTRNVANVTINNPAMFYIEGDSGLNGTISYTITGLKVSNAFIGRIVRGISYKSFEDDLEFSATGIAGLFQGEEQTNKGNITITAFAGDITGGWWLQRNNTTTRTFMPPYPATDVWLSGWCDSSTYKYLAFTSYPYDASNKSIHDAIDNFYNTYFFKTANSATTANGGRLTNTSNNSYTLPTFKGISGRGRYITSRYSRQNSLNVIEVFKSLFTIRAPIYMDNCTITCKVINAMVESVGLIASAVGNISGNWFGIDVPDPWLADTTIFGVEGGGWLETVSAIYARPGKLCRPATVVQSSGLINESWALNTNDYRLGAYREWNPSTNTQTYLYDFYRTYAKMKPIIFYDNGPQFSYTSGTYTPIVSIAGTTVTPTISKCTYYTLGKMIKGVAYVQFSTLTISAASEINITLPGTNGAWDATGQGVNQVYMSHITDSTILTPVIAAGTNNVRFRLGSGATVYQIPTGTYTSLTIVLNFDYIQQ